jgi:hypothetical protein
VPTPTPPSTSSQWEHPCDGLPDPTLTPLCQATAVQFNPTYEGIAPSAQKPFPLVVFSTGWNNRTLTYSYFAERLASHGFVVAVMQHHRDGYATWDIPKDAFSLASFNRPRDVSFVLDALLARNDDPASLLFQSIKPDQVAAAGHSVGGYAALALAGGDDEVCVETTPSDPLPEPCTPVVDGNNTPIPTMPDPRFRAIATLDGGNPELHFSELARITVPALSIGEDVNGTFWSSVIPPRQHAAMSGHPNYRVDVRNTFHQSFTSSCTGVWISYRSNPTPAAKASLLNQISQPYCLGAPLGQGEAIRLSAEYAIAFLKTHLAGETGYQRILTPGWANTREDYIEFFVTEPAPGGNKDEFRYFPHQGSGIILSMEKDPTGSAASLEPIADE